MVMFDIIFDFFVATDGSSDVKLIWWISTIRRQEFITSPHGVLAIWYGTYHAYDMDSVILFVSHLSAGPYDSTFINPGDTSGFLMYAIKR